MMLTVRFAGRLQLRWLSAAAGLLLVAGVALALS